MIRRKQDWKNIFKQTLNTTAGLDYPRSHNIRGTKRISNSTDLPKLELTVSDIKYQHSL